MIELSTTLRLSNEFDIPFIYDSWCRSQHEIYPNKYMDEYSAHYHEHIRRLLDDSIVAIACLDDDPDEIISYIAYTSFRDNFILHYAYTKVDARRQGNINKLINYSNILHAPLIFTHPPKNEKIMERIIKRYIFDPSIMELIGNNEK